MRSKIGHQAINGTFLGVALHLLAFGLDLENAPRKTGYSHLHLIGASRSSLSTN